MRARRAGGPGRHGRGDLRGARAGGAGAAARRAGRGRAAAGPGPAGRRGRGACGGVRDAARLRPPGRAQPERRRRAWAPGGGCVRARGGAPARRGARAGGDAGGRGARVGGRLGGLGAGGPGGPGGARAAAGALTAVFARSVVFTSGRLEAVSSPSRPIAGSLHAARLCTQLWKLGCVLRRSAHSAPGAGRPTHAGCAQALLVVLMQLRFGGKCCRCSGRRRRGSGFWRRARAGAAAGAARAGRGGERVPGRRARAAQPPARLGLHRRVALGVRPPALSGRPFRLQQVVAALAALGCAFYVCLVAVSNSWGACMRPCHDAHMHACVNDVAPLRCISSCVIARLPQHSRAGTGSAAGTGSCAACSSEHGLQQHAAACMACSSVRRRRDARCHAPPRAEDCWL